MLRTGHPWPWSNDGTVCLGWPTPLKTVSATTAQQSRLGNQPLFRFSNQGLQLRRSKQKSIVLDSTSFFKPAKVLHASTCNNSPQFTALPKILITIPSHFLNFPPKPCTQWCSSIQLCPSMSSHHDSKSCFKPPPPKALHAMVFLNSALSFQ